MGKFREVEINGCSYPISFGMGCLADFTREAGLTLSELGQLEQHLDLQKALQLVHFGLKHGGRIAGKPYENDFFQTCDLMDVEEDALNKVLDLFAASLPNSEEKKARPAARKAKR